MSRKEALLTELTLSRTAVKQSGAALREELDYLAKVRNSIRSSPGLWLGGAVAVGYILAGPKVRVKTVYKKSSGSPQQKAKETGEEKVVKDAGLLGVAAGIFRIVFPMVRPALHAFLAKRATEWLSKAV